MVKKSQKNVLRKRHHIWWRFLLEFGHFNVKCNMNRQNGRQKPMYFYFTDDHSLEFFANDRYTVLNAIAHNQVNVDGFPYCFLPRQEIADICKMPKEKVGKIIRELLDKKYLDLFEGKRGKYYLTEKGAKALWIIQSGERQ